MTQLQSSPPPSPSRPNLRRSRRQSPKGNTKARAFKSAMGLGANIAVSILDVSETGIRLVVKEALPCGHEFHVTLESISHKPVKAQANVVWCVPGADGNFCVGARFQKNLPYADLTGLARM